LLRARLSLGITAPFGFPYPPARLSLGIMVPFRLSIPSPAASSGYHGAFSAFHTLPCGCLWVSRCPFGFSYPLAHLSLGITVPFRLFIPSRAASSGYHGAFSAFHTLPRGFFWVSRCLFGFSYPPPRLSLGITVPFRLFIPSRAVVSGYHSTFRLSIPSCAAISGYHSTFRLFIPSPAASSGYHGALSAFHTLLRGCLWVSRCLFDFPYPLEYFPQSKGKAVTNRLPVRWLLCY